MSKTSGIEAALVLDRSGRIIRFDLDESATLLGQQLAVGQNAIDLFPESLSQLLVSAIDAVAAGRGASVSEWRSGDNGDAVWKELTVVAIDSSSFMALVRDITAVKDAEREARRNKRMLDTLIDLNPYAIIIWDNNGKFILANRAAEEFVGMPTPEDFKANFNMFESPTLKSRGIQSMVDILRSGVPILGREDWQRASEYDPRFSDELRCVEYNVVPVMKDGALECVIVLNNDITERRLAEMEVDRQRQMLENIIELNPYAISMWDRDGYFVRANKAWLDLLGGEPPKSYSMFVEAPRHTGFAWIGDKLRAGETVVQPEAWFNPATQLSPAHRDRSFCARVVLFSIKDTKGEPDLYVGMLEDITEQRKAEMELQRVAEERYDQVKAIAGGTAHEIYNALFPAKSLIVTLREKLGANTDGTEARVLRLIQDAVNRAIAMTDTVMKYSRLESDRRHEQTSLRTVIEEVIQSNQDSAKALDVIWEIRVDQDARISLSRAHAFSLFNNLAVNSLDALAESPTRKIIVSSQNTSGRLTVEFRDSGSGIAPENLSKVFNAFFSTKPRTGTGLGLAMVQKIVQLYDGKIEVDSTPGVGTKFTLIFPTHDQPLTETPS